jgi:hypothetical protein
MYNYILVLSRRCRSLFPNSFLSTPGGNPLHPDGFPDRASPQYIPDSGGRGRRGPGYPRIIHAGGENCKWEMNHFAWHGYLCIMVSAGMTEPP